jgi:hypothetical protein
MTDIEHDPAQLDFFDLFGPPPTVIQLPPCGRGLGPCKAIVEHGQIHCVVCGCSGPYPRACAHAEPQAGAVLQPTFLDGYIKSQMKFLRSR